MTRTKYRRASACIALLLLSACSGGGNNGSPPPPPPAADYVYAAPQPNGDTWPISEAASEGIATTQLEDMMTEIGAGNFHHIDSVAIARNGRLVFEETIRMQVDDKDSTVGNGDPAVHAQFSASKSITALLIGIAIDDGLIQSVDVSYLSLFPYASYDNWDVRKNEITLEHVLAMHAGLAWDEWDPPYSSPDNQWNRLIAEEVDWSKALLDLPMAADPGTVFAYNTAATVSLGQAIENVAPMALVDYGLDKLLGPLGISTVEIAVTPTGLPNGGSGFYLKTRDMAKFGQLVLNSGEWNGERIVSAAWVDEMTTPRTSMGGGDQTDRAWIIEGYGYQWWTGYFEVGAERFDSVAAWGWGGQWVFAVPALGLSVAINSSGYSDTEEAYNQAHRLLRDFILPAAL